MTPLSDCRACGGAPLRAKKRMRKGMRWRVYCPKCGYTTRWHRPNGGDIHEWNERRAVR